MMPKPSFQFAIDLYTRYLMEQQAELCEQGSIFSINDPELRALELSNAKLLREQIALFDAEQPGGPGSPQWEAECEEFGCRDEAQAGGSKCGPVDRQSPADPHNQGFDNPPS